MITTLSLLLLLIFALGFWIVKSSSVPSYVKVSSIIVFFTFCVMMAITLDASMGWAANGKIGKNLPTTVTIRSVEIHEPNQTQNFNGSIYLTVDLTVNISDSALIRLFGHSPEGVEPRLYRLPYSRTLHEKLQKLVIPQLQKGQSVTGNLEMDSRHTEIHFYNLPPSDLQPKKPQMSLEQSQPNDNDGGN